MNFHNFFQTIKNNPFSNETFLVETEFELSEQELKQQEEKIKTFVQASLYRIYSTNY
jgi:hypothetical protein